ncbi:MAG: PIN domain nuclease [Chloroflexota bacterium]
MKLLLDTHTFLWYIAGSPQLSTTARLLIEDPTNETFISIASLWEMAIKIGIGRLSLAAPFEVLIPQQISLNGFRVLDILINHLTRIISLLLHHRDPFDRLLIAQAMSESMSIVSADAAFDQHPVTRLW